MRVPRAVAGLLRLGRFSNGEAAIFLFKQWYVGLCSIVLRANALRNRSTVDLPCMSISRCVLTALTFMGILRSSLRTSGGKVVKRF